MLLTAPRIADGDHGPPEPTGKLFFYMKTCRLSSLPQHRRKDEGVECIFRRGKVHGAEDKQNGNRGGNNHLYGAVPAGACPHEIKSNREENDEKGYCNAVRYRLFRRFGRNERRSAARAEIGIIRVGRVAIVTVFHDVLLIYMRRVEVRSGFLSVYIIQCHTVGVNIK